MEFPQVQSWSRLALVNAVVRMTEGGTMERHQSGTCAGLLLQSGGR